MNNVNVCLIVKCLVIDIVIIKVQQQQQQHMYTLYIVWIIFIIIVFAYIYLSGLIKIKPLKIVSLPSLYNIQCIW